MISGAKARVIEAWNRRSFDRDAVIEECARVCEQHQFGSPVAAHAIRALKSQPPALPSAIKNGLITEDADRIAQMERDAAIHKTDCPTFRAFWEKHALGSKLPPSCLCCGQVKGNRAIQHAELPDIYICDDCRTAAMQSEAPHHCGQDAKGGE